MEITWGVLCCYIGLAIIQLCNGLPIELLSTNDGPNGQLIGVLVAAMVSVCAIIALIGCVCCQRRAGFKEFRDSPVTASVVIEPTGELSDPGHVNPIASPEFTIFTPLSPPHHNNNVFRTTQPAVINVVNENIQQATLVKPVSAQFDGIDVSSWFDGSQNDFPRTKLKYIRELGSGWFGRVVEGEAQGIIGNHEEGWTAVVVRILESSASAHEQALFLHEANMYRIQQPHEHVLKLLGRSLEATPLLLIQEYCPRGDLKRFLRENKPQPNNSVMEGLPLQFCCQLASALQYLHDNNIAHLDLAARTCQISSDISIRLGDYGLAVSHYPSDYYQGTPAVPVRWCAPETLNYTNTTLQPKQVTCESNIWSLGVTMWEVCEWGAHPYDWLTDDEVISQVIGPPYVRLQQPSLTAFYIHPLYRLMQLCWQTSENRPEIHQVYSMLLHLMQKYHQNIASKSPSRQTEFSMEDFDSRWETFKPNTIVKTDNHISSDMELSVPCERITDVSSLSSMGEPVVQKSASLTNLHGSFDNLADVDSETPVQNMDSWLQNVASHTGDMQYVRGLSQAIQALDSALASEQTSSSDSSYQPSPGRDQWEHSPQQLDAKAKPQPKIEFKLGVTNGSNVAPKTGDNEPNSLLDSLLFTRRSDSGSETEDETWRKRIERGVYSEKVRQKSKSVADLMILTHIDCSDTDSETPLQSLEYRVNYRNVRCATRTSLESASLVFGSEGNLLTVQDTFQEELRKLQVERRDSLLFVPACQSTDSDNHSETTKPCISANDCDTLDNTKHDQSVEANSRLVYASDINISDQINRTNDQELKTNVDTSYSSAVLKSDSDVGQHEQLPSDNSDAHVKEFLPEKIDICNIQEIQTHINIIANTDDLKEHEKLLTNLHAPCIELDEFLSARNIEDINDIQGIESKISAVSSIELKSSNDSTEQDKSKTDTSTSGTEFNELLFTKNVEDIDKIQKLETNVNRSSSTDIKSSDNSKEQEKITTAYISNVNFEDNLTLKTTSDKPENFVPEIKSSTEVESIQSENLEVENKIEDISIIPATVEENTLKALTSLPIEITSSRDLILSEMYTSEEKTSELSVEKETNDIEIKELAEEDMFDKILFTGSKIDSHEKVDSDVKINKEETSTDLLFQSELQLKSEELTLGNNSTKKEEMNSFFLNKILSVNEDLSANNLTVQKELQESMSHSQNFEQDKNLPVAEKEPVENLFSSKPKIIDIKEKTENFEPILNIYDDFVSSKTDETRGNLKENEELKLGSSDIHQNLELSADNLRNILSFIIAEKVHSSELHTENNIEDVVKNTAVNITSTSIKQTSEDIALLDLIDSTTKDDPFTLKTLHSSEVKLILDNAVNFVPEKQIDTSETSTPVEKKIQPDAIISDETKVIEEPEKTIDQEQKIENVFIMQEIMPEIVESSAKITHLEKLKNKEEQNSTRLQIQTPVTEIESLAFEDNFVTLENFDFISKQNDNIANENETNKCPSEEFEHISSEHELCIEENVIREPISKPVLSDDKLVNNITAFILSEQQHTSSMQQNVEESINESILKSFEESQDIYAADDAQNSEILLTCDNVQHFELVKPSEENLIDMQSTISTNNLKEEENEDLNIEAELPGEKLKIHIEILQNITSFIALEKEHSSEFSTEHVQTTEQIGNLDKALITSQSSETIKIDNTPDKQKFPIALICAFEEMQSENITTENQDECEDIADCKYNETSRSQNNEKLIEQSDKSLLISTDCDNSSVIQIEDFVEDLLIQSYKRFEEICNQNEKNEVIKKAVPESDIAYNITDTSENVSSLVTFERDKLENLNNEKEEMLHETKQSELEYASSDTLDNISSFIISERDYSSMVQADNLPYFKISEDKNAKNEDSSSNLKDMDQVLPDHKNNLEEDIANASVLVPVTHNENKEIDVFQNPSNILNKIKESTVDSENIKIVESNHKENCELKIAEESFKSKKDNEDMEEIFEPVGENIMNQKSVASKIFETTETSMNFSDSLEKIPELSLDKDTNQSFSNIQENETDLNITPKTDQNVEKSENIPMSLNLELTENQSLSIACYDKDDVKFQDPIINDKDGLDHSPQDIQFLENIQTFISHEIAASQSHEIELSSVGIANVKTNIIDTQIADLNVNNACETSDEKSGMCVTKDCTVTENTLKESESLENNEYSCNNNNRETVNECESEVKLNVDVSETDLTCAINKTDFTTVNIKDSFSEDANIITEDSKCTSIENKSDTDSLEKVEENKELSANLIEIETENKNESTEENASFLNIELQRKEIDINICEQEPLNPGENLIDFNKPEISSDQILLEIDDEEKYSEADIIDVLKYEDDYEIQNIDMPKQDIEELENNNSLIQNIESNKSVSKSDQIEEEKDKFALIQNFINNEKLLADSNNYTFTTIKSDVDDSKCKDTVIIAEENVKSPNAKAENIHITSTNLLELSETSNIPQVNQIYNVFNVTVDHRPPIECFTSPVKSLYSRTFDTNDVIADINNILLADRKKFDGKSSEKINSVCTSSLPNEQLLNVLNSPPLVNGFTNIYSNPLNEKCDKSQNVKTTKSVPLEHNSFYNKVRRTTVEDRVTCNDINKSESNVKLVNDNLKHDEQEESSFNNSANNSDQILVTSTPFKKPIRKVEPQQGNFVSFVSGGDPDDDMQTVILGPCEDYTLRLYSGLKTTFERYTDDDRPEEELLQFSSNFMPLDDELTYPAIEVNTEAQEKYFKNLIPFQNNPNVDYSLETWDRFLGKSFPCQENNLNSVFDHFSLKTDNENTRILSKTTDIGDEQKNETFDINKTISSETADEKINTTFKCEQKGKNTTVKDGIDNNTITLNSTEGEDNEKDVTDSKPVICNSWEPGEGWFLHPQVPPEDLTGQIDVSLSDNTESSYVGFTLDEECVNALRTELAAKLPHAQGVAHDDSQESEDWDNEERSEILVKYNVYATPLSPIPEESCCDDIYFDPSRQRDDSDSDSDWSEPGLGRTSQLEDILVVDTETHTALILESPSLREPQHRHTPSQDSCCSNDTLFNLEDLNYGPMEAENSPNHKTTNNTPEVSEDDIILQVDLTDNETLKLSLTKDEEDEITPQKTDITLANNDPILNQTYTKPNIDSVEPDEKFDSLPTDKSSTEKSTDSKPVETESSKKLELTLEAGVFGVAPLPSPEDIPWRQLPASLLTYNEVVQNEKFEMQDTEAPETEQTNDLENECHELTAAVESVKTEEDLSDSVRECTLDTDLYSNLTDIRFSGPCDTQLMSTSFSESAELADERDWDSGSDTRSSSSGEFIWKEGEHEESLRALHAASHDVAIIEDVTPMDAIEEENSETSSEDSDDGDEDVEETEFVPSAWDAQATPTKSALRSPEKSNKRKNQQKGVWFKKQKYHCVYEYPREPDSPIAQASDLWRPLSDFSNFTDWELDPESCVPPFDDQSLSDCRDGYESVLDKYVSRSSYPLASSSVRHRDLYQLNPFPEFTTGLSNTDDDFYISSSARPFQSVGQGSQFFPGQESNNSKTLWQEYQPSSMPSTKEFSDNITPDSGVEDVTPAGASDPLIAQQAGPSSPLKNKVQSLKYLATLAANKVSTNETKNQDSLGGMRHTRNRLKLDLPPSPNSFTSTRTFTIDVSNDPVVNREVPTFTTFGKSRFSVQHVQTPTDDTDTFTFGKQAKVKNVSFEALPHKPLKMSSTHGSVYILDNGESRAKHKPVEMVQGEASLLDSADEDSGIESSANATLERHQQILK